jgi:hypothetical protein
MLLTFVGAALGVEPAAGLSLCADAGGWASFWPGEEGMCGSAVPGVCVGETAGSAGQRMCVETAVVPSAALVRVLSPPLCAVL